MRRAAMILGGLAYALTSLVATAQAQVVLNPVHQERHAVAVGGGLENALVLGASYARRTSLADVPVTWVMQLQVPWSPGLADLQLGFGAAVLWVHASGWGVTPQLLLQARRVDGQVLVIEQAAVTLQFAAGMFQPRWSAAVELTLDKPFLTHARVTPAYRREVQPAASHVWTFGGGGILRAGLQTSLRLVGRSDLTLRGGVHASETLGAVVGMPFYALVGFTQGF